MAGNSSEARGQYQESRYSLDVKRDRKRLTEAWWSLLGAIRASAPKKELYRLRREYLAVRADMKRYAEHEIRFTLAQCARENRKQLGLPDCYSELPPARSVDDLDAEYYIHEREDAGEAERAVEPAMLPNERSDKRWDEAVDAVLELLSPIFRLAGLFFLLWGFIWLIKTLWYLS